MVYKSLPDLHTCYSPQWFPGLASLPPLACLVSPDATQQTCHGHTRVLLFDTHNRLVEVSTTQAMCQGICKVISPRNVYRLGFFGVLNLPYPLQAHIECPPQLRVDTCSLLKRDALCVVYHDIHRPFYLHVGFFASPLEQSPTFDCL